VLALVIAAVLAFVAFGSGARAADFVVSSASDSGAGSLRQAIIDANASAGPDRVTFAAPVTVQPATALPTVSDPLVIDGYSVPGTRTPTTFFPWDGSRAVAITTSFGQAQFPALTIVADDVVVRGIAIAGYAVGIRVDSGSRAVIAGNSIGNVGYYSTANNDIVNTIGVLLNGGSGHLVGGPEWADTNLFANNEVAVRIADSSGGNAVVGNAIGDYVRLGPLHVIGPNGTGVDVASSANDISDNAIFNNTGMGIHLEPGADSTTITGNLIGAWGWFANYSDYVPGNAGDALQVESANNRIGGTGDGDGNDVSSNGSAGIRLTGATAHDNDIVANNIRYNLGDGLVLAVGAHDNRTTPSTNAPPNVVSNNQKAGIDVVGDGAGNVFRFDAVTGNNGLGIDLGGDGVTPNDPLDADLGPNRHQNFPDLESAVSDAATTTVSGVMRGMPNATVSVDLYANDYCHISTHGEGQLYLASTNLAIGPDGTVPFRLAVPALDDGTAVTATATSADGTSEMSECLEAASPEPSQPSIPPAAGRPLPPAPIASRDTVRPKISALTVLPHRFAVAAGPTPVAAQRSSAAKRAPSGARIRVDLSETANVALVFERLVQGHKSGTGCLRGSARRGERTCTVALKTGELRRTLKAGRSIVPFTGRVGRAALRPGTYRLTARAVDLAGNPARLRHTTFVIAPRDTHRPRKDHAGA
jgi:hypothetical protein